MNTAMGLTDDAYAVADWATKITDCTEEAGAKLRYAASIIRGKDALQNLDYIEVKNCICDLFASLSREQASKRDVAEVCATLMDMALSVSRHMPPELAPVYWSEHRWEASVEQAGCHLIEIERFILKILLHLVSAESAPMAPQMCTHHVVEIVQKIIQTEYREDLNTRKIAQRVFLSPNYLSKLFKSETDQTITDFIIAVRMKRAKELLSTRMGLKSYEVGEMVGYSDPVYFNKVFKKIVGVTPKQYANQKRTRGTRHIAASISSPQEY